MKKIKGKLKRVGAFLIIMLLCFNNFAAIVSDNDGSAFITKAEFDSLKNNFQTQIDNYNTSIDSKIDGAIAAYLAGIRVATTKIDRALFAKNAGATNNITCRLYSFGPFQRCYHNMSISLTYAVTYTRAINNDGKAPWGIWAKNFKGSLSKSMSSYTGKRLLVNEIKNSSGTVTGYKYVGYSENYGEKWDISWVRDMINTDDGFASGTHYLNPFCWLGTQNSIFNAGGWTNWKTSVVASNSSGQLLNGTNVIVSVTIPDHKIEKMYDFVWEDNANNSNSTRVYLWIDNQITKFVAGKVNNQYFGYTNSDMWSQLSMSGTSMQYMDASSNGSYMNRVLPTVNKGGGSAVSSTYKGYYQPMTAPLNVNGNKWSTIYYNDTNEYTYKYSATSGASSTEKTIDKFRMTNGIPLYPIEEEQTIEWAYQFSNAQDGRKIYLKPGVFDGSATQMNDSEVVSFDASKQTGTIKYTAKRSDMLFVKWTAGNTIVTASSGSVKITSPQ